MTLEAGHKLGPYEIISPIGKGGMGEETAKNRKMKEALPRVAKRSPRNLCLKPLVATTTILGCLWKQAVSSAFVKSPPPLPRREVSGTARRVTRSNAYWSNVGVLALHFVGVAVVFLRHK
jgi:hypothetical protein